MLTKFCGMLPKFYPILDTAAAERHGIDPVSAARQILEGGARILQFRHKGFYSRDVFRQCEAIAGLCRDAGVPFVVNDRADLAALFGAVLHVGQDDLPPLAARKVVGAGAVVGYSTHNEAQLRAALGEPANYLALGPLFGTASKENPDPTVGLDEFRRLRKICPRPLVAIGGITRSNAKQVLEAGADSLAIIGDLFPASGSLSTRVRQWIAATESTEIV
jgi:thiamine-phosphate pyrophosphorylase